MMRVTKTMISIALTSMDIGLLSNPKVVFPHLDQELGLSTSLLLGVSLNQEGRSSSLAAISVRTPSTATTSIATT